MSSVREQIEWDYGDVGRFFPLVDYKNVLKLRAMPVGAMYLTAMIFRNAFNTLYPCLTSIYFGCQPPTLADWLRQGPNARNHIEVVIG